VGGRLIKKWILTVSVCLYSDLAANGHEVEEDIVVCYDNRSLPDALKCDFKWDCLEGTDELDCGKFRQPEMWCLPHNCHVKGFTVKQTRTGWPEAQLPNRREVLKL
jgi:hypothetical protein